MNEISLDVSALPQAITIGRRTETGVLDVRIDCSAWLAEWPGLRVSLWVTPPGGAAAPVPTRMDGKVLVWPISDTDTACSGQGTMEVVGEANGVRKLSSIAKTNIT